MPTIADCPLPDATVMIAAADAVLVRANDPVTAPTVAVTAYDPDAEFAQLLFGALGNEARREDLAERGIVLPPGHAHEIHHGLVLALRRRRIAPSPSSCVTSAQDHPVDALRMTELDAGDHGTREAGHSRGSREAGLVKRICGLLLRRRRRV